MPRDQLEWHDYASGCLALCTDTHRQENGISDFYSLSERAISIVTLLPDLPGNVSPTCGNAAFEKCTTLRLPSRPEKVEQLIHRELRIFKGDPYTHISHRHPSSTSSACESICPFS